MQSLFQRGSGSASNESGGEGKPDLSYRVWFVVGLIFSFSAIWSSKHYELAAKVAWTLIGPGFTFSQVWRELRDIASISAFGLLLVVHCVLMKMIFPLLPFGHYGYILLVAIGEIMTIGLAYQVWLKLRKST